MLDSMESQIIDKSMLCRHRQSIINSLQDTDISIRRRSLDLLFAMCSKNNVREIVAELLDYLQAGSACWLAPPRNFTKYLKAAQDSCC